MLTEKEHGLMAGMRGNSTVGRGSPKGETWVLRSLEGHPGRSNALRAWAWAGTFLPDRMAYSEGGNTYSGLVPS